MVLKKIWVANIIILVFTFSAPASTYGQIKYSNEEAIQILNKVSGNLSALQSVSYKYKRESLYSGENYHNIYTTEVFIDFTSKSNNKGYRFQANEDKSFSCYNGVQYFWLQKTNKTIDIKQRPGADLFESLSPLYNSLISLRTIIPLLVGNDSIKKTITDTIINKDDFYRVHIELYNQYFGNLGSINNFTSEYIGDKHKPYEVIINKKSFLPYQYVTKFKDRSTDFITATFLNINTNPEPPKELSWFYSTYTNEYLPPTPKKPLIAKGIIPANWVLPAYSPDKVDSLSLYQYRGKIVMLDFWIKSCGPCIASFPHLNNLQKKFGADKFQLLSINTEDPEEDIAFFYKKHKPVYKMLFEGGGLVDSYGIPSFPTIILLSQSGKIIYTSDNGFDQVAVEKMIKENL